MYDTLCFEALIGRPSAAKVAVEIAPKVAAKPEAEATIDMADVQAAIDRQADKLIAQGHATQEERFAVLQQLRLQTCAILRDIADELLAQAAVAQTIAENA